jgi:hypothetical protein
MKRHLLTALALVFCFTISLAQGDTVQNHLKSLDETYSLSTEQKASLHDILTTRQVQIDQISHLKETHQEDYKNQLVYIKEQTMVAFQNLLSEEQMGIYRQEMSDMGALRRSWMDKVQADGMSILDIHTAIAEQLF